MCCRSGQGSWRNRSRPNFAAATARSGGGRREPTPTNLPGCWCVRSVAASSPFRSVTAKPANFPHTTGFAHLKLGPKTTAKCSQGYYLRHDRMQKQVTGFFKRINEFKTYDIGDLARGNDKKHLRDEIGDVEKRIAAVQKQINTMIIRQADAPESIQEDCVAEIRRVSEQRDALKKCLQSLQSQLESSPAPAKDRRIAAEENMNNLDKFWTRPNRETNQVLHRAMGKRRFVVRDGQVVDVRYQKATWHLTHNY